MSHPDRPDEPTSSFYEGNRGSEEYEYKVAEPLHNHSYLAPGLLALLGAAEGRRVLDMGCGNGTLTARLAAAGFKTTGAESSASGLAIARETYPELTWVDQDIDQPLRPELRGQFDVVLAAEVIEHLFLPRRLFDRADEALAPGGRLVLTTPFHGYWKNLALAVTGKFDVHWRPSWDYGHIKFWSVRTLTDISLEKGFRPLEWKFLGRIPQLAKSMIMVAERA